MIRDLRVANGDVTGHALVEPAASEDSKSGCQMLLAVTPFALNGRAARVGPCRGDFSRHRFPDFSVSVWNKHTVYTNSWQARGVGRPAQIDRAAVIGTGLAIADEKGLDAVTMKAVSDRLEVTPMALYRHVTNKADLLDGVVESLIAEFEFPSPELPWRERFSATIRSVRIVANRHPDVFALLLTLPANTPMTRGVREGVHAWLREAGVEESRIPSAERIVTTLIFGYAVSEATGRFRGHSRAQLDRDYACIEAVVEQALQAVRGKS